MYNIEYTRSAMKDFAKLPANIQKQIIGKLDILVKNPFASGQVKALKGEEGGYRLRVGNYRVVYYIENARLVITVVRLGHRKDIY